MSELDDKIKKVFLNPQLQRAVVEQAVSDKPKGWGRKSNAPYFKEIYGLQMRDVVSQMMSDRQPVLYDYDTYLQKYGYSKETLYLRVNQSLRYLTERLDPDDMFKNFMEMVDVTRERGLGVLMRIKPEFVHGPSDFQPRPVELSAGEPKWKQSMDDWLENSTPESIPFHKEGLALNPEEIKKVELQLEPLVDVLKSITSHSIKLVKIVVEVP